MTWAIYQCNNYDVIEFLDLLKAKGLDTFYETTGVTPEQFSFYNALFVLRINNKPCVYSWLNGKNKSLLNLHYAIVEPVNLIFLIKQMREFIPIVKEMFRVEKLLCYTHDEKNSKLCKLLDMTPILTINDKDVLYAV